MEYQITKLQAAYKNGVPVKICLSYKQIKGNGKYKLSLSKTQQEKLYQSKELKKWLELELSHEQIKLVDSYQYLALQKQQQAEQLLLQIQLLAQNIKVLKKKKKK